MANYKKKILKISKGQIASELVERTDIGILDSSGQLVSNFINSKFGLFSTTPGSVIKDNFNVVQNIKLFKLNMQDGTDCALAITTTPIPKMIMINSYGEQFGEDYNIPDDLYFIPENLHLIKIAQNNDIILIASPNSPLLQLKLKENGSIESLSRFDIKTEDILKSSVFVEAPINPTVIRISESELPENPADYGISIGKIVILSQEGNPSTDFPWSGQRLARYQDEKPVWEPAEFRPSVGNYCFNNFDNTYWLYINDQWEPKKEILSDITYNNTYKVNAVSGVVEATGFTITITKPDYYKGTPEEYAKKLMIGCDFDGNDGLGIFRISKITGTTSGNDYKITKISGATYISFAKADTNYSGFTITYSMLPAFDADKPGTKDNIYNTQNYPLNIFFYQQRLFIAGTVNNPTQILASNVGKYNDFSDDYSGASTNAFQLIISGTEKETIQNVLLNQGLQIFTDKGEWITSDSAITKDSGFVRNSTIGSSYVSPIISANGITIFCPKQGNGIVGFIYNQDNASFNTPYISMLTDIFDAPVVDMCLKKGYTANDDTLIYMPLQNGKLVIANYLQDQEIQAFVSRSAEETRFLQILQLENNVILLVKRGSYTQIELLDYSKNTAASITDFKYNPTYGLITNLPTLYTNKKVNVYDENNDFIGEYVVSNNQIQLKEESSFPKNISEVGFNIHNKFVSNPQNINQETFSLYKTIRTIKLALTDSSRADYLTINGKHGRNKDNFITYIRPTRPLRKCQFTIENDRYKLDIMSIEIELEA